MILGLTAHYHQREPWSHDAKDSNTDLCKTCGNGVHHELHYVVSPCACEGCWACEGKVYGCTCDVDWEKVFGSE